MRTVNFIENPDIDYEKDGDGPWNDFAIWDDGSITCGFWYGQETNSRRVWSGRRPPTREEQIRFIHDRHIK